ncbi:proteasome maturation factor ump1 protein [Toxoplasma gondii ME49]|uniref:Proteasome maturation factor ump1 protein n=11 Tax=Toxoplasma gondii TaxID=5811 RepID=A0A0F7URR6_TOXGV|nr:proteasome maturation factor ump1 protein [Toxoplasma gondii ME49]EPR57952.1 proteasome maturation factor ump1 protein [Toxoplasma gondii GT1]ESS29462.1 proteasome maturation factor ump1 protein [Toxoplasma gondii VEG]KAF4645925.1 proteasome maturation factor ump1 protein [Toxoplasma gondii]KFG29275.1 proteasome maturation factor ump1 protein [Toxoplasma gondii p89]KFG34953.1 proteasome maturation factor ump1 protein [Toxoplasma gondii GAB2-2007-GAL-DOM2]KFG49548.1 proteasome maturation fa|eukprot:XP_002369669.1 proteasome maturation factor ump1 protein [Toxoplasma gondii ME49]
MDYEASASAASAALAGAPAAAVAFPPHFPNALLHQGLSLASPVSSVSAVSAVSCVSAPPPAGLAPRHPLETRQSLHLRERERTEFQRAARLYGLHAPLRLKMERELCAMSQRLPGLPSSLWGLQTLMRLDEEVAAEDFLNREKPDEDELAGFGPGLGIHEKLERRMGI